MELTDFSYDELMEEIKRRDTIKAGPWPKTIELEVELVLDSPSDLDNFLKIECGLEPDELEGAHIMDSIGFSRIKLQVFPNGDHGIVEFDGRKLEVTEKDNGSVA